MAQVKALKQERERKQKQRYHPIGGPVVGREERFKQDRKTLEQQGQTPGPGSYIKIGQNDISSVAQAKRAAAERQALAFQDEKNGMRLQYYRSPKPKQMGPSLDQYHQASLES